MKARKPLESEASAPHPAISAEMEDWMQQFIKHLESHLVDAGSVLSPDSGVFEMRMATARAILATFVDSGMELESALELLGQVAIERGSDHAVWNDELNQRRFELIDKEIQGVLTPIESVELAGLTRTMRDNVESEMNLPMKGARKLHRKLRQIESTGESD